MNECIGGEKGRRKGDNEGKKERPQHRRNDAKENEGSRGCTGRREEDRRNKKKDEESGRKESSTGEQKIEERREGRVKKRKRYRKTRG